MRTQHDFERDVQAVFDRLIPNPNDPRFERKHYTKKQLEWRKRKSAVSKNLRLRIDSKRVL